MIPFNTYLIHSDLESVLSKWHDVDPVDKIRTHAFLLAVEMAKADPDSLKQFQKYIKVMQVRMNEERRIPPYKLKEESVPFAVLIEQPE